MRSAEEGEPNSSGVSESSSMQPATILARGIIAKPAEAVKERSCVGVLEGLKKFTREKKKKKRK